MDYGSEQELIPAAPYPQTEGMQTELHLIDAANSQESTVQQEAAYVARQVAG